MAKIALLQSVLDASDEAFCLSAGVELLDTEQQAKENHMDYLLVRQDGLAIKRLADDCLLKLDFESGKIHYRSQRAGKESELLLKAVSAKQGLDVLDATAGVGRDAWLLANAGCNVTLCERHPVMYLLLSDALGRVAASTVENISLFHQDSMDYLQSNSPSVVYLDPMFPSRKKSAAVKKDMQLLQDIVGTDPDIEELVLLAVERATHRVVLKRPLKAPQLAYFKPDLQLKGKSTRFDICIKKKI